MTGWAFVTVTDDAFAPAAAVTLLSAAASCAVQPVCVIVDFGMSEATRATLDGCFEANRVTLHVRGADSERYAGLPLGSHLRAATYGRLSVAELAADLAPHSLYLDADTLTVGSLDGLLATDLCGQPVGAVQDPKVHFVHQPGGVTGWDRLGLPPATAFFNAGVMVIDNRAWGAAGVSSRALDLLASHPEEATFADQGALNAVLAGAWLPLDRRWNVPVPRSIGIGVRGRVLSRHGSDRLADMSILHFLGTVKPWQPDYAPSPYRAMYQQAMRRLTPQLPEPRYINPLRWARIRP
jgi:lipopolysaccharide biosynthesis glycosyltransferase